MRAQDHRCTEAAVASIPSRPTVANATDVTQCGIAELEYGLERQWPGGGAHRSDFSGGMRFGLTPNLDFHWFAGNYIGVKDSDGERNGYGDNWFGLKYRFLLQTKHRPSLGIWYSTKTPTGDLDVGSSGEVDHQFAFLISKDVHRVHWDFNVIPQMLKRAGGSGFDHNVGFAWATWLPVTKRLTLVSEPYGLTAVNADTPGYASVMTGASFRAHRRLYLDGGTDLGASRAAPVVRVFGGVTYAIGNVYTWLLPERK